MNKISVSFFVVALICIGMAVFCVWFNNTQVASHSDKDALTLCAWASCFLGGFAIGKGILSWSRE